MVSIHLSPGDLAQVRFAFSALWETVASYRVLKRPDKYPLHLPWLREAHEAIRELDMSPLAALMSPGGYADFLTPTPSTPLADFDSELQALLATPYDIIEQDIANVLANSCDMHRGGLEGDYRPYLNDPGEALGRLANMLQAYWQRALEPHWPRIRTLLETDILYRARTFALHGPEKVFSDLHPRFRYQDHTLTLGKKDWDASFDLSGRGLLLIPSVFSDHTLRFDAPWQEALQYGARGTAGLWRAKPPPAGEALQKLFGETRARLLKQLLTPSTTTQLAQLFGVTPSAVSQHLGWLYDAGLVSPRRNGKQVHYTLSETGAKLLELYQESALPLALAS